MGQHAWLLWEQEATGTFERVTRSPLLLLCTVPFLSQSTIFGGEPKISLMCQTLFSMADAFMKDCEPYFLSRTSQCGASSACLCSGPRTPCVAKSSVLSRHLSVIGEEWQKEILRHLTGTETLGSRSVELNFPRKLRLSVVCNPPPHADPKCSTILNERSLTLLTGPMTHSGWADGGAALTLAFCSCISVILLFHFALWNAISLSQASTKLGPPS